MSEDEAPVRIKYPLPCGCAGPLHISKCEQHQQEDLKRLRRQLGIEGPEFTAEQRWLLRNAFWRMFNHGTGNNTASAQCEVQALDMFMGGRRIEAWKTPVTPVPRKPGDPLDAARENT